MINKLASQSNLTIFWVRAHVGQIFNERADELAKSGLTAPSVKQVGVSTRRLKQRFKEQTQKLWMEEWHNDKRFRQTKVWFPNLNHKNSKRLLKFGRCKLGAMVQWITGFCNLMMHRHRKHGFIDPTCRRCELTEETPIHLTWECPALYGARVDCLKEWDLSLIHI